MKILVMQTPAGLSIDVDGLAIAASPPDHDVAIEVLRYDSDALRGSIQRADGGTVFTGPEVVRPYIAAWHDALMRAVSAAWDSYGTLGARHGAMVAQAAADQAAHLASVEKEAAAARDAEQARIDEAVKKALSTAKADTAAST